MIPKTADDIHPQSHIKSDQTDFHSITMGMKWRMNEKNIGALNERIS